MKKDEILEKLKAGEIVTYQEHMSFKRGKVKRGGNTISYSIGEERITSTQFDSIKHLLKRVDNDHLLSTRKYELIVL